MGEGNNLFNTFSFNVWKADNAEVQMEKKNKKRRKKQVRKLKVALKNDKLGKPGGGGGLSAEELKTLVAFLAAEDSGGDNDTESDIDDDMMAEVGRNAYLLRWRDAVSTMGEYDEDQYRFNRAPPGLIFANKMAATNTYAAAVQNRPPEPLPPMNVYNPYPMGLQQQMSQISQMPRMQAQQTRQQVSGFRHNAPPPGSYS